MATLSKRWRLDIYTEPTERRPPKVDVAEALYALQIEATDMDVDTITNSPFGSIVVAIVKHMARSQGSWGAVELDGPSVMDDDEPIVVRPRIEDVIEGG